MGGLIEVGGIEVNAIDALLYVWFVLAGLIPHHTTDNTEQGGGRGLMIVINVT